MTQRADEAPGGAGKAAQAWKTRKFLTFSLDEETYGVEVVKVKEIVGLVDITAVPNVPPYVKGVMNLRGRIVPVVDLRLKFGFPAKEYTGRTCIIVVESEQAKGKALTGLIVDSVAEVTNISDAEVEKAPDFGEGFESDLVMGLAKARGTVVIMLDIDRVLAAGGLVQLGGTA